MATTSADEQVAATDLARECLYRFLAAGLTDPYTPGWGELFSEPSLNLACQAAELLRDEGPEQPAELAFGELPVTALDVTPLIIELQRPLARLQDQYDRTFGLLVPRECPPYETEYLPSRDAFYRAQQLSDVAGFYRAFGLQPARARGGRPDFLGLELEFMALVLMKKRLAQQAGDASNARLCNDGLRKFFAEHLAWWVPAFAVGLRRKAGQDFYAVLSDVLAAFIPLERQRLGVPPPDPAPGPAIIEPPDEQTGCATCPLQI